MYIIVSIVALAVITVRGYSFQTSSVSVNHCNQYISPSNGVNLFSGGSAFALPLTTLAGRGGLSAPITIAYAVISLSMRVLVMTKVPQAGPDLVVKWVSGLSIANRKGTALKSKIITKQEM